LVPKRLHRLRQRQWSPSLTHDFKIIRQSKRTLEQWLGRPVRSFAYPYGHYAAATSALVRKEGFSSACSGQAGLVSQQSDLFWLPRIKVEDWDGERLAMVLAEWFTR